MAVVIVAIPGADDRVWKTSSEKIPHLTLMYLGDDVPADNLQRIVLFVEHVANTTLERFGLSVDRRGELGDKKADVLFFEKKHYARELKDVLGNLLTNRDIYDAFHSVEQFPEWTPHLTLGYPEAPAKELNDDYAISYVHFDRIAVWTGDYDGPEFRLKEREMAEAAWSATGASAIDRVLAHARTNGKTLGEFYETMDAEERDVVDTVIGAALDDISLENNPEVITAYEALPDLSKYLANFIVGFSLPTETVEHSDSGPYLAHYGVKGMRWGVRKDPESRLSTSSANTKEARSDARSKVKAGTATLGEAHLAGLKSKGHRVANAFLGDKHAWTKQIPIWAGITAAGVAASFAAPALIPAGTLASIGAAAYGTSALMPGAAAAGAQAVTAAGLGATAVGSQVYSTYVTSGNVKRAVLGNRSINDSYAALGKEVTRLQTEGTRRVQKTLQRSGSLRKKDLAHTGLSASDISLKDLREYHNAELAREFGSGILTMHPRDYLDLVHSRDREKVRDHLLDVWSIQVQEQMELQAKDELAHDGLALGRFLLGTVHGRFLAHYGIKGMRWGVRRSDRELQKARADMPADADAVKAVETQAKINAAGSLNVVSSKDLQQLVERIKLEQRYIENTMGTNAPTVKKGESFIVKAIKRELENAPDGPLTSTVRAIRTARENKAKAAVEAANAVRKAASEAKASKKAAADTQKAREQQARYNSPSNSSRHPGPFTSTASTSYTVTQTSDAAARRSRRAQQVYNVTSLNGRDNPIALPSRRK